MTDTDVPQQNWVKNFELSFFQNAENKIYFIGHGVVFAFELVKAEHIVRFYMSYQQKEYRVYELKSEAYNKAQDVYETLSHIIQTAIEQGRNQGKAAQSANVSPRVIHLVMPPKELALAQMYLDQFVLVSKNGSFQDWPALLALDKKIPELSSLINMARKYGDFDVCHCSKPN